MEILALVEENNIPLIVINNDVSDDKILPRGRYKQWIGSILPDDVSAGKTLIRQLVQQAESQGQLTHTVLAIAGLAQIKPLMGRHWG